MNKFDIKKAIDHDKLKEVKELFDIDLSSAIPDEETKKKIDTLYNKAKIEVIESFLKWLQENKYTIIKKEKKTIIEKGAVYHKGYQVGETCRVRGYQPVTIEMDNEYILELYDCYIKAIEYSKDYHYDKNNDK